MLNSKKDSVVVPASMIPSFNVSQAFERGVSRNFLIKTWGGIGDQVAAEPAIRFALKTFSKCRISLASENPELFTHLKFAEVFNINKETPDYDKYMVFETIKPPTDLLWEFASHMVTHCVDFASICMFRCQLPNAEKEIQLPRYEMTEQVKSALRLNSSTVIIHPGKHWASKTFPKAWWDQVITAFFAANFTPVIIGKKVDENVGYVDVDVSNSIDLRDKLSMPELISLLQNCKYLFSNDSSPIHIASSSDAFIGYVASCKHPDYITHWRKGQFGHKTYNFGLDGIWNHLDYTPVQESSVEVEQLPKGLTMDMILPSPQVIVEHYCHLRGGAVGVLGLGSAGGCKLKNYCDN